MRHVNVPLKAEALPTMAPSDKDKQQEVDNPMAKMHFFDPVDLFKRVLSSQLANQLRLDVAFFVDDPKELYHSRAWASSVRTSSGHYAHFVDADGELGDPIFPSDWVYWCCGDPACGCMSLDEQGDDESEP
ncbi:hypothetical protein FCIRC_8597 [Fusarium circinatum]|uniref:Uncharacterized protein n=1 Tax=Fusarium circinatum TaxID=48490 RepID=A0A8H5WQN8_FUSCI|nr:hypothetical protein FCIRC_8597 [Fusarium circinatum]